MIMLHTVSQPPAHTVSQPPAHTVSQPPAHTTAESISVRPIVTFEPDAENVVCAMLSPCPGPDEPLVDVMGRYRAGGGQQVDGYSRSSNFYAFSTTSNESVTIPLLGGRYQKQYPLGEGACGQVWAVQRPGESVVLAAKIVPMGGMNATQRRYATSEAPLMSTCDSPFVVKCVDSFVEDNAATTIMELVRGMELSCHIRHIHQQRQKLSLRTEGETCVLAVQLLLAVHHIHGRGILHRDLKSGNVFLSAAGLLKIGDFGLSTSLQDLPQRAPETPQSRRRSTVFIDAATVGTPTYMAPELWNTTNPKYSTAADMFSVGVMLYELVAARHPFKCTSLAELAADVFNQRRPDIRSEVPGISDELASLITSLLSLNPHERPTAFAALQTMPMRTALTTLSNVLPLDENLDRVTADAATREVVSVLSAIAASDEAKKKYDDDHKDDCEEVVFESVVEKWTPASNHNHPSSSPPPPGNWKRRMLTLTHSAIVLRLPDGVAAAPGSGTSLKIPLAAVTTVAFLGQQPREGSGLTSSDPGFLFDVHLTNGQNSSRHRFSVSSGPLLQGWMTAFNSKAATDHAEAGDVSTKT